MITKTGSILTSKRYTDPTNELLVNYVNSGEAQQYGTLKQVAPALAKLISFGALVGGAAGAGAGKSIRGGIRGTLGGAGIAALGTGYGMYNNYRWKTQAKNMLNKGNNRLQLAKKIKELREAGVNTKSNNALNGYLRKQLS